MVTVVTIYFYSILRKLMRVNFGLNGIYIVTTAKCRKIFTIPPIKILKNILTQYFII